VATPISLRAQDLFLSFSGAIMTNLAQVAGLTGPLSQLPSSHLRGVPTRTQVLHQRSVQTSIDEDLSVTLERGKRLQDAAAQVWPTILEDVCQDTFTSLFRMASSLKQTRHQVETEQGWSRLHGEVRMALCERGPALVDQESGEVMAGPPIIIIGSFDVLGQLRHSLVRLLAVPDVKEAFQTAGVGVLACYVGLLAHVRAARPGVERWKCTARNAKRWAMALEPGEADHEVAISYIMDKQDWTKQATFGDLLWTVGFGACSRFA
jgi:hypothetical protein